MNDLQNKVIAVEYKNYRGETAVRKVIPLELYYGNTEYHPQDQWLLRVWDMEKDAERIYSLQGIKKWLWESNG